MENSQFNESKNKENLMEKRTENVTLRKNESELESKNQVDNPSQDNNNSRNLEREREILKEKNFKENISFSHAPGKLLTANVAKESLKEIKENDQSMLQQKLKELELKHKILEENYREAVKKCNDLEIENERLIDEVKINEEKEEDYRIYESKKLPCNCKKEIQETLEQELKSLENANCVL